MKREANVDLWRIIGIMMIVLFHARAFEFPETYGFSSGYLYVEFFFFLTGYFTARHFCKGLPVEVAPDGQGGYRYAIRKFRKMMPYVFATVFVSYLLKWIENGILTGAYTRRAFVTEIELCIKNMLLLTSAIVDGDLNPTVFPNHIWYLASMMVTLPLICLLLQSKLKDWYAYYFSWVGFLLLHGRLGFPARGAWPRDLLRAFVCMSMGVFIYAVSVKMKERLTDAGICKKIGLTLAETGSLLLPVILCYKNSPNSWLIVISFTVGLICMLSGTTYSALLRSRALNWLGEFSFYLFLCHYLIIRLKNVWNFGQDLNGEQFNRLVLRYVLLSWAAALLMYAVGELCQKIKLRKGMVSIK